MSQHMYLNPGIEMVLLTMSFAVVMSAVGVLISPVKTIKILPIVNLVICGSYLCGL